MEDGNNKYEEYVYGIVYEPSEPDFNEEPNELSHTNLHAHEILLMTWDGRVLHTHGFSGVTSLDIGHRHSYSGMTNPSPSGVPHTHTYATSTTLNDGHVHDISGTTGPAIPAPGGGHYHYFEGVTSTNGRKLHSHSYSGRTGNSK